MRNYEFHITVAEGKDLSTFNLDKFIKDCKEFNIKPIFVVLHSKKFNIIGNQIMTGYKVKLRNDEDAIEKLNILSQKLENKGYRIIRKKIETDISHELLKDENKSIPNNIENYLEIHIETFLKNRKDFETLSKIAVMFNALLSKNILKNWNNNYTIEMITLRCWNISLNNFRKKVNSLIKTLKNNNIKLVQIPNIEFSIYDTNHSIDDEWIKS